MNAERLKKIEEVYHAAAEISPIEREIFFDKVCGEDADLRREVESLLAVQKSANNFLENPPESLVAEMFSNKESRKNLIGGKISHYKIIKLLGIGGMGEVYLAEDTKLGRQIALKLLPSQFEAEAERKKRFEQEARAVSALNHPNIITIHEIEEVENVSFIATEFIDGQTLRTMIAENPLTWQESVEIAIQILSALESAHSVGIVHRDIKPANIMIRQDGIVKVLDFGLAKLTAETLDSGGFETREQTAPNRVMGTANYMSPEQAKGKKIDARTDIFSFGVVFYEMLTGKLPFEGKTSLEIIGAILHEKAKPIENQEIPDEIEKIVSKCLIKNRNERYQTIKEVLIDLKEAKTAFSQARKTFDPLEKKVSDYDRRTKTTDGFQKTTNEIISRRSLFNRLLAVVFTILLISAAGFFAYRYFTIQKQIKSIAVMPFVNESGNKDVEYLSDGMTENLISSLSNIPHLSIKARSTVFTYKGKTTSAQQIGKELNVDAVLLGRLIQRGDNLKVNLELVDTSTQDVLWSENYERKMNYLVSLESEIARNVSDNLRLKLTRAEQDQVAKTYTTNSEAQQLYLKGRFHWNKRNKKDFDKAIEYFNQAIEKDPNYALAYAGLADTYALMPLYDNFRPKDFIPQAKQSALKAIELDPKLAEPRASLAYIINTYDYDWEAAEREYKTAIKLNPNYPTAHQWYAEHLAFKGMPNEALKEISKALELDPFSVVINRMKGNVLGFAQRHDEAIAQLQKTLELYPENSFVRFNLGDAYAGKKLYSKAIEQYLIALKLNGESPENLQKLETAYKTYDWKGFWNQYLKNLEYERKMLLEADPTAYYNKESLAFAYAATKNKDKSFEYLYKAFEERDPSLVTIKMSEVYDFLRDDPRYKELMKKIGLPE